MASRGSITRIALAVVAIVIAAAFIDELAGTVSVPSLSQAAGWIIVLVLGYWIGIAAHELGHAAAGLACGMTLLQFAVQPVLFDWTEGSTRVRWIGFHERTAGRIRFAGDDAPNERTVRDHYWMTLGGPLGGAMCGLGLLAPAMLVVDGWLKPPLLIAGLWNITISAINLHPVSARFGGTDWQALRVLSKGGPDALAFVASTRWMELLLSREAPSNWPDEVVRELEIALAQPQPLAPVQLDLALAAGYLLYLHYADRQEWIEANHVIATAVDLPRLPETNRHNSRFDLVDVLHAVHLARRGRNPKAARMDLQRVHPRAAITRTSSYLGARAAIALAEGDPVTAIELAGSAREMLAPSISNVATDRLEDSWWEEVILEANKFLTQESLAALPEARVILPAPIPIASMRDDIFAWDPGVPSDLRTVWIWRSRTAADLDLSA